MTSSKIQTAQDPINFCFQSLRDLDREQYLADLYLPEGVRQAAIVLHAFDAEISRIPKLVSEPGPGEIRLQFWRDFLKGADKQSNFAGPLGLALRTVCTEHSLPLEVLDQYLDARIFDLYHDPMPDTATLEGYCGETASSFYLLICLTTGQERSAHLADLCGHAGMVKALLRIINQLHFTHATKCCYIPLDILNAAGINQEEYLATSDSGAHNEVVSSYLSVMAKEHLEKTRLHLADANPVIRPVFCNLSLVAPYLKKIAGTQNSVFKTPPRLSPLRVYWHLWRGFRT